MEKGVSKHWTEEKEQLWARRLSECHTFAERHLTTILRNVYKYDGRSKESKKADALARLQLITATDADLEELATLETRTYPEPYPKKVAKRLEQLKKQRDEFRGKGIKRSDLICT